MAAHILPHMLKPRPHCTMKLQEVDANCLVLVCAPVCPQHRLSVSHVCQSISHVIHRRNLTRLGISALILMPSATQTSQVSFEGARNNTLIRKEVLQPQNLNLNRTINASDNTDKGQLQQTQLNRDLCMLPNLRRATVAAARTCRRHHSSSNTTNNCP
jgi:hypothetical protein